MMGDDEYFMHQALKEAQKAYQADEVPVGAVLVLNGKVIAKGYNQVELLQDATAHAEMLCLTSAASALQNWRLLNTTLYCTVEPCCMCAGAMYLSRIARLVWGANDIRQGAGGSWINVFEKQHPIHQFPIQAGILADECGLLMKKFFQKQRKKNDIES